MMFIPNGWHIHGGAGLIEAEGGRLRATATFAHQVRVFRLPWRCRQLEFFDQRRGRMVVGRRRLIVRFAEPVVLESSRGGSATAVPVEDVQRLLARPGAILVQDG